MDKINQLAAMLAKQFERDFVEMAKREIADPDFLNMKDFGSCRDRAKAGIDIAISGAVDSLGYAIALHEEKSHSANTTEEQAVLLSAGADPEVGILSWWND